jgi:rRNA maturation endonuclease Nob1
MDVAAARGAGMKHLPRDAHPGQTTFRLTYTRRCVGCGEMFITNTLEKRNLCETCEGRLTKYRPPNNIIEEEIEDDGPDPF